MLYDTKTSDTIKGKVYKSTGQSMAVGEDTRSEGQDVAEMRTLK